MEIGFIRDSKVLIDTGRYFPIQGLSKGDDILCFVMGHLFPAKVAECIQCMLHKLVSIEAGCFSLKGGCNQPIYHYNNYIELNSLEKGDFLLKQKLEPEYVKNKRMISISAPVYILRTYPDLPFIVNGFVVGSMS